MTDLVISGTDAELLLWAAGMPSTWAGGEVPQSNSIQLAIACYLAREETWPEARVAGLLQAVDECDDVTSSTALAAVAVKSSMLELWWANAGSAIGTCESALRRSRLAVSIRPDWVSGWLVIADAARCVGNLPDATNAGRALASLPLVKPPTDPVKLAFEVLFTGRVGWGVAERDHFVTQLRERQALEG